MAKPEREMNTR